jgi:hypothetical protein
MNPDNLNTTPIVTDSLQTSRELATYLLEAAALDFRAIRRRVDAVVSDFRNGGDPASLLRATEKLAADLAALETLAWREVEKNR